MIYHSKRLDLEITDFEYHHHPKYTGEVIPSQTSRYVLDIVLLCETESIIPRASQKRVEKVETRRAEQ